MGLCLSSYHFGPALKSVDLSLCHQLYFSSSLQNNHFYFYSFSLSLDQNESHCLELSQLSCTSFFSLWRQTIKSHHTTMEKQFSGTLFFPCFMTMIFQPHLALWPSTSPVLIYAFTLPTYYSPVVSCHNLFHSFSRLLHCSQKLKLLIPSCSLLIQSASGSRARRVISP